MKKSKAGSHQEPDFLISGSAKLKIKSEKTLLSNVSLIISYTQRLIYSLLPSHQLLSQDKIARSSDLDVRIIAVDNFYFRSIPLHQTCVVGCIKMLLHCLQICEVKK